MSARVAGQPVTGKHRSALRFGLAALALGALGLAPAGAGAFDAHAALAFAVFAALPLGAFAGASREPLGAGLAAAAGLLLAFGAAVALGPRAVPTPVGAGAVLVALLFAGHALGGQSRGSKARPPGFGSALDGASAAAGGLLVVALLAGIPGRAGLSPTGFAQGDPGLGSLLLDLSPLTLAFECAGMDWQTHPAVYGPAGTDWFSGERRPWRAGVAAPIALVLGCGAALAAARRARSAAPAGPPPGAETDASVPPPPPEHP